RTASSREKCNRTSSGQVCSVPTSVNLKVCANPRYGTGVSNPTISAGMTDAIAALHNIPGWAFNFPAAGLGYIDQRCELGDGKDPADPGQSANIIITQGPVGSSGTGSNDIKDYVSVEFIKGNGSDNLSEGSGV